MRALLIVNPHATSTTRGRADVIIRALGSALDLKVVHTRYRGDATRLAASAAAEHVDLVITLGGDGTVNEAVNGLLGDVRPAASQPDVAELPDGARPTGSRRGAAVLPDEAGSALSRPALAVLPGGNANVFIRSLGLPGEPVDAAAQLIKDLSAGKERQIGLGQANGRYFTFNAGLGLDAEVVRAVEGQRAHGRNLTPMLFLRTALRQYYQVTDRRRPAITVETPLELYEGALFLCIISNATPWTYLGRRPVVTSPQASFDAGLDLLGFRSLATLPTLRALRQMLTDRAEPLRGRSLVTAHDLDTLLLAATHPLALQLDGEYMGEVEKVRFRSVPKALRVIG